MQLKFKIIENLPGMMIKNHIQIRMSHSHKYLRFYQAKKTEIGPVVELCITDTLRHIKV